MDQRNHRISQTESIRFRTGAAMPSRLGSEQLRDETTAVLELVKNSYDADATTVKIIFKEADGESILIIEDDGSGMTSTDLHDKWAWLATENKLREDRSPALRRPRLGQKGVGRFATEKLGRHLTLRTRVKGEAKVLRVRFDWDQLEGGKELSDYEYRVHRTNPKAFEPPHGTTLIIKKLRLAWTRPRLQKLRDQLCRLIDPEATTTDFKIWLDTPNAELNGHLQNPLPGNETHRLEFDLLSDGSESVRVLQNGVESRQKVRTEPPLFGPVHGRLRYFRQGLQAAERGRGGSTDSDWNVGVRIFRDGCRVRPYGEPGPEGDWLQIYRARARYWVGGALFRLRPQYLEGTIHITKSANPQLRDTTSREGLDANDAYEAFVEYVKRKIAKLSEVVADEEQREERARSQARYSRALEPLAEGLSTLKSEQYKRAVESADVEVRRGLKLVEAPTSLIRNAHWECLDCSDSWKVPLDRTPTRCREFSVGRDGRPTTKPGCGSVNVRRKENVARNLPPGPPGPELDDVLAGVPAYISGVQIRPIIDWEMGEQDVEAEVRPERRCLAINGRHPAFRAADRLDGNKAVEGSTIEDLGVVGALTMHITDTASHAWGKWHFDRSKGSFEEYVRAAQALKSACVSRILGEGASSKVKSDAAG